MILPSTASIVIGSAVIVILSILSVRVRALDATGALAGALISFATLFAGGLSWLAVVIAFVLISSLLTRYRYDYKQRLGSAQEKGGTRSWPNALANGLIAGIVALFEIVSHHPIYSVAYLAAVASAMSDTIATEIGLLSNSQPRLITNLRKVIPGTSGGVSGLGELAGLVTAFGISVLGIVSFVFAGTRSQIWYVLIAVIVASFMAMNFDSLLGATIQGRNKCKVCGTITENLHHHGQKTESVKGFQYLDNNVVNLVATVVASLIAVGIYLALVS